jgi:hypothetical protein
MPTLVYVQVPRFGVRLGILQESNPGPYTRDDAGRFAPTPGGSADLALRAASAVHKDNPQLSALWSRENDPGAHNRVTILQHTSNVLRHLERQLDLHQPYLDTLSQKTGFKVRRVIEYGAALHDIGKPLAYDAGDKHQQHKLTQPIFRDTLKRLKLSEPEIDFGWSLFGHDWLGAAVQGKVPVDKAAQGLAARARYAKLAPADFAVLFKLFYLSDVAAYPRMKAKHLNELPTGELTMRDPRVVDQVLTQLAQLQESVYLQETYNPTQPRIPAGSGKESGRWAKRGGSGQVKILQAHYREIKPELEKIAESYTGHKGQRVEARDEEWTDQEREAFVSDVAEKMTADVYSDPVLLGHYKDLFRQGSYLAWEDGESEGAYIAVTKAAKITAANPYNYHSFTDDAKQRFAQATDEYLETPAGKKLLRDYIYADRREDFLSNDPEERKILARTYGATFPTRTIGEPIPFSKLSDFNRAKTEDLYIERTPPNAEAKAAARIDLELDLAQEFHEATMRLEREGGSVMALRHPNDTRKADLETIRGRLELAGLKPDLLAPPEVWSGDEKMTPVNWGLIQREYVKAAYAAELKEFVDSTIARHGADIRQALTTKAEKFQRFQFNQLPDDQKAAVLESAGLKLPIYTRTPSQFRPFNSAPGGEQDLADYHHTQEIARLIQRDRTIAIASEKNLTLTPEQAADLTRKIWSAWKHDSGNELGLALQAASYNELRSHNRTDPEREKKATEGYQELGENLLRDDPEYKRKVKAARDAQELLDRKMQDDSFSGLKELRANLDAAVDEVGRTELEAGKAAVQAHVRATWEASQYVLDKAGVQQVQTYRAIIRDMKDIEEGKPTRINAPGVTDDMDVNIGEGAFIKLPDFKMQRNGAQSTTLDLENVANTWQGAGGVHLEGPPVNDRVVLRIQTPNESVLSLPCFGQNVHNEQEIVLTGISWQKWDAWQGKAPRIKLSKEDVIQNLIRAAKRRGETISREAAEKEAADVLQDTAKAGFLPLE